MVDYGLIFPLIIFTIGDIHSNLIVFLGGYMQGRIDQFIKYLVLEKGASEHTCRSYFSDLSHLAGFISASGLFPKS
ncbi:MAG: site-specific integrase, partial [Thermodesulfobacteriota bacterium]